MRMLLKAPLPVHHVRDLRTFDIVEVQSYRIGTDDDEKHPNTI
jgi:hypothetical protein